MKKISRLEFAHLPTKIESMDHLSSQLGGPKILIKRDDQTGLAFGGNKTRKLEFLVADALDNGAKTLITAGAVQSNHCRQTAAAAAHFGLSCKLVITGNVPNEVTGNYLLDHILNAETIHVDLAEREAKLEEVFQLSKEAGQKPYLIPYGASNPIGATGYVTAIEELMQQNIRVDWVVFPSSSGGTQAGMMVGKKAYNFMGNILGISVDKTKAVFQESIANLANKTAEMLDVRASFTPDDILINTEYLGDGYGVFNEFEKEAIELFAQNEGILLDPVYTGRAAAGLIDLIRKGKFSKTEVILFWHTGGTPALFADKYIRSLI